MTHALREINFMSSRHHVISSIYDEVFDQSECPEFCYSPLEIILEFVITKNEQNCLLGFVGVVVGVVTGVEEDVPGVEDDEGAIGVVVAGGVLAAALESVPEGCTINDIVLDGPAFDVWWDIAEDIVVTVVVTVAEDAVIVAAELLWPETVSAIIAHAK